MQATANQTRLMATRMPTDEEKARGAEIVFEREGDGSKYTILAAKCHESWEQWGAPAHALSDNIFTVERWLKANGKKQ